MVQIGETFGFIIYFCKVHTQSGGGIFDDTAAGVLP